MPASKKLQYGGGSRQEYCFCCGFPFVGFHHETSPENIFISPNGSNDYRKLTEAEREKIAAKSAIVEKQTAWLGKSIGLDSVNNIIFDLGPGADNGYMFLEPLQIYPNAHTLVNKEGISGFTTDLSSLAEKDGSPSGLAIHKHCAVVLQNAIKRELRPSDENLLRHHAKKTKGTLIIESPCFSKYNDQFFSWYDAMLDDSVSFASPLIDERQKTRIEHCNATMINAILTSAKGGYRNMRRTRRK
jgi:hypothetical protein